MANLSHRRLDILLPEWLEKVDAFSQTSNVDFGIIGLYFAGNLAVAILCLVAFVLLRTYGNVKWFAPKVTSLNILPTKDFYSWAYILYNIDEATILQSSGYDVLLYIRFYKLALNIMCDMSIYALLIILPVNGSGTNETPGSFDFYTISNLKNGSNSLWAHVLGVIILTLITAYYLEKEFVVYANHRHNYLQNRHAHFRTVLVEGIPRNLRSNVVLATYFELLYPNAVLRVRLCQDIKYLDRLVARQTAVVSELERCIHCAAKYNKRPMTNAGNMLAPVDAIMYHTRTLESINQAIAVEQKSVRHLAHLSDLHGRNDALSVMQSYLYVNDHETLSNLLHERGVSPKGWIQKMDYADDSVKDDSISDRGKRDIVPLTYREWFRELENAASLSDFWYVLRTGRALDQDFEFADESIRLVSAPEDRRQFLSKAFVTFKTFTAATIARQVLHTQLPGRLAISEAAESRDVIWNNVYTSRSGKRVRSVLVELAVIMLTIVWIAPVTLVYFVLSAQALRARYPSLDQTCQESRVVSSAIALIQPVTVMLIMDIIPILLSALATYEGAISMSSNQRLTFRRYFNFQVVNVFLATTMAGSVLDSLFKVLQSPQLVFLLLGESLPKMAGFFTAYMLVRALTGLSIELLRLVGFLFSWVKVAFTPHTTARDKGARYGIIATMDNPGWFPHAKFYAQDMLLVVVCMTYASIAPVVILAGIIYFALAGFVYKHQMLYVYEPCFESGGSFWPLIAGRLVFALLIAQMTMIGMLILMKAYTKISVVALLMFCTLLYYLRVRSLYEKLAENLPFDHAVALDLEQRKYPDELAGVEEFIQPSLRAPTDVKPRVDEEILLKADI